MITLKKKVKRRGYKTLAKLITSRRETLAEKYKVKEIGLFGSVVRGAQHRKSDVDILVDFDEIPDLFKFLELERYLRSIVGKKVDLIDKQGIRPELRKQILDEVVYL